MQRNAVRAVAVVAVCALVATGCGRRDSDDESAGPGVTSSQGSVPATNQRREQVGTLENIIARLARINGAQVNSRSPLAAGDLLATDSEGEFDFSLEEKIKKCRTLPGSELRVQPGGGVLVEWTAGSSLCVTTDDPAPRTFTAGGAQLRAADPTFEVTVERDRSMVRVMHGFVEVGRGEATVMVGPGQQTTVPKGRQPSEPGAMTRMTAREQTAFEAIRGLQPVPDFRRPDAGRSAGLARTFRRGQVVVAVDGADREARQVVDFAEAYFGFLSRSWDLDDPEVATVSLDTALTGLRQGRFDVVFTPADPGQLPSFPILERNGRILRAVVADNGQMAALESFTAQALNSGDYGRWYDDVFGGLPRYKVFQPLLFRS